jgi:hypothetical protein
MLTPSESYINSLLYFKLSIAPMTFAYLIVFSAIFIPRSNRTLKNLLKATEQKLRE